MFPWARPPLGTIVLAAVLLATPSAAQPLDYSALEQLFAEPVTVSATGKPQRVSDVPVSMEIINAEQIRRSGARDVPGVLARYTSLDVQQFNAHDYSVGVRGYATPMTPRLLVLVNGRQVYLDDYGRTAWHSLPVQLAEIRQIEVVKGPNSALYGFNAVGGVINIITFDPLREPVNTATLRIGSGRYGEAAGVATAPLGQSGAVRLSAGLRSEDAWRGRYDALELMQNADRAPARGQLAADMAFGIADGVRIGLDGSYTQSRTADLVPTGFVTNIAMATYSLRGRISVETASGLAEAALYHSGVDATVLSEHPLQQGVTVAQASLTTKLTPSQTMRYSAELRHNTLAFGPSTRVSYDSAALGTMWNWTPSETVETTLALRYDALWLSGAGYDEPYLPFRDSDYDRFYGTLAWNAGLVWRATELDALRVSAARGVGLPSLIDMGGVASVRSTALLGPVLPPDFPRNAPVFVGSPRLEPTVVDNYEVGWRRDLPQFDARLGVSAFYQISRSLGSSFASLDTFQTPLGYPVPVASNIGTSRAHGFDLSAAGRIADEVTWGLDYRLAVVDSDDLRPAQVNYAHASPRHLISARLGWSSGPVSADLFGRYATQTSGYRYLASAGGYHTVTARDQVWAAARIARRLDERFTLAIEGEGVVQQREIGLAGEPERRVFISLRADF